MAVAFTEVTNAVPSNDDLIAQHRIAAEAFLRFAERSSDPDEVSRYASLATGHAVLAMTYISRPVQLDGDAVVPDLGSL